MVRTKASYVWEQRVTEYKASGQTAQTWCKSNDVRPATLRYWIRVFKATNTSTTDEKVTSWISVDATELKIITKAEPLIVKIGDASIEINLGFDKDLFSKVAEVLLLLC